MSQFLKSAYHFHLPETLIAHEPLLKRDQSRLMVVNRATGRVRHGYFSDLVNFLTEDHSLQYSMVANNTRVFRARLLGEREGSAGKVEFFLLKEKGLFLWEGFMKAGAKVLPGFRFQILKNGQSLKAEVISRHETDSGVFFTAQFDQNPLAENWGEVPLPPYIEAKRKALQGSDSGASASELEIYNTVYAEKEGSVAAPTAGRHFTPELIQQLKLKNISWHDITLHVGVGTFKPVSTADIRDHQMHEEWVEITESVASKLNQEKKEGKKILAVGTTTTRALEGSFQASAGEIRARASEVNLFLYPGGKDRFHFVDALITNFHLPESSLLMMVAAFLELDARNTIDGREWILSLYQEAIREQYRFYSYGDAMLIL